MEVIHFVLFFGHLRCFFLNHVVNVYLLKVLYANAATTLQRKETYSMVSVSVEELYL